MDCKRLRAATRLVVKAMREGATTRVVVKEARGSADKYACSLWYGYGGRAGHGDQVKIVLRIWVYRGVGRSMDGVRLV